MLVSKTQRVLSSFVLSATLAVPIAGCGGSLTRAQEALAIGDDAEAERQLRKALKSNSTRTEASRQLSVLLARQGAEIAADQPREAEAMFSEALELDSRNEEARVGLARLLMKRGFMADARKLLDVAECRGCGRLMGIMLHEEAVEALAAGEVETAREHFQAAYEASNDPLSALGLVQTWLAAQPPDLDQAQAALAAAASLISRGQVEAENLFRELRLGLLNAAAAARDNERVEAILDIRTPSLEEEPEFDLRFKISQEQFRNGDSDPAIARISSLIEKSGKYLDPTQLQVMTAALVVMYSARAAQHLQAGDEVGAAKDIAAGLKLDPENNRLKLQQVLAIAANRMPLAFDQLKEAHAGKSRDEVEAILHSLEAFAAFDKGKIAKAEASIEKAEELAEDLPEVRLAQAYLLAETRNDDLSKDEAKEVRSQDLVDYPRGRINQYPGALAHLARARELIVEQGVLHSLRGFGFDQRVEALDKKLAFYPYEVEWYAGDKGGLIELFGESGQKTVEYRGPRWLKGTAIAAPGNSAEVPVPNVGLVTLEYGGKHLGVVTEDHAHIKIKL